MMRFPHTSMSLWGRLRSRSADGFGQSRPNAFTLVEMVIVVGIVLILLGIALPSINTMWAQHRENDANNGISGMLMSTRAKAVQGERGEVGMFFYLDKNGVQQIAIITRDPRIENDPNATSPVTAPNWRTDPAWQNVFTVAQDGGRALIAPMRAVPRYVVEPEPADPTLGFTTFNATELGNDDFDNLAALPIDNAQRHRNYFVVLFSPRGELEVGRDVLIRDPDVDGDDVGDITGLAVSDTAKRFYAYDKDNSKPALPLVTDWAANVSPESAMKVDVIVGGDDPDIALNFPSVDGVMVYDDSAFREAGDDLGKREVLLETAQPYYIHRLSGAVVRGPVGEVPDLQTNP